MNFKIIQHNEHLSFKGLQYTFNMCKTDPDPDYDGEWFEDIHENSDLYCIDYCTNMIFKYTTP